MIKGRLFEEAERAKKETVKGQYNEELSLIAMDEYTEKMGDLTREDMIKRLEEENIKWIAEIVPDEEDKNKIIVISKEGYIFEVIVSENGEVEVINKGEGEPPKEIVMPELVKGDIVFEAIPSEWTNENVVVEISTHFEGYILEYSETGEEEDWLGYTSGVEYEENGIIYARLRKENKVSNVSTENVKNIDKVKPIVGTIIPKTNGATFSGTDELSRIIAYGYSESNNVEPTNWTGVTEMLELTTASLTNLRANTKYYIWLKDKAGNTGNKGFTTGAMPTLDDNLDTGNITFSYNPSSWTKGNVVVTINTEITGYTLEYSKTGIATDWSNYVGGVEYEGNGTIYARITDGTNVTNVATGNITNIDKLQPNTFTIAPTSTANSITCPVPTITDATATTTNGSSGIAKIEYMLTGGTYSTSTRTWSGLVPNTNYRVYVRTTDNAGNVIVVSQLIKTEVMPGSGNITLTPSTTAWTKGDVTVKVTASVSGYTLQYSTNGTSWTNITSGNSMTMTGNGTVYARLWDGLNAGTTATRGITNIDKLAPNTFTIAPTSTANSITCPVPTITDATATTANGSSGIAKIEYMLTGGTYSTSTRTWSGLVPNTNYRVYVRTTDNAGNAIAVSQLIKTEVMPGSGNITLTPSTTAWTKGDVTVKIATNVSGYTLQYSTNNSKWTNISSGSSITMTANGTVYARLTDGKNIGTTATRGITNIDKTVPNSFNISYVPGDYQITTYASTIDGGSGVSRYEYYLSGTLKASTGTSYVYTGLNQDYDYTLFVRAYDYAGNYRDSNQVVTRPNFLLTTAVLNQGTRHTPNGSTINVTNDGFGGLQITGRLASPPKEFHRTELISWRKEFNFSRYNKISFNYRKGADHGMVSVFLSDAYANTGTTGFDKSYLEMSTSWAYQELDISNWGGGQTLFIVGGYSDNTGDPNSTTYYYNVRFHAR